MSLDAISLTMLRASAIERSGQNEFTWMSPANVIKLLDDIDEQYSAIKALRAELAEARAQNSQRMERLEADELAALRVENVRLRRALTWIAHAASRGAQKR